MGTRQLKVTSTVQMAVLEYSLQHYLPVKKQNTTVRPKVSVQNSKVCIFYISIHTYTFKTVASASTLVPLQGKFVNWKALWKANPEHRVVKTSRQLPSFGIDWHCKKWSYVQSNKTFCSCLSSFANACLRDEEYISQRKDSSLVDPDPNFLYTNWKHAKQGASDVLCQGWQIHVLLSFL